MDEVIVATSVDRSDDALVSVLESSGIEVYRGELSDVLARYVGVIQKWDPQVVVRLTADCPLASALVIDHVISEFLASDSDYASNTLTPTYPDGLDVEVVRSEVLQWLNESTNDLSEREHVTLGVYRRPESFRLHSVRDSRDNSDLRWTVDEADDLDFVRWVYAQLYRSNPGFEYEDVLNLLGREPSRSRTSADSARNAALEGLNVGAMERKPPI